MRAARCGWPGEPPSGSFRYSSVRAGIGDLVRQCLGPRTLELLALFGADEAGLDDRERQEARQHGASAGAHERQGHACRGNHLQDAADIDKYLHAVKDSDAGNQDLIEIISQRG